MSKLRIELRLVDECGRVHGVVVREVPREAAFQGNRISEETRLGVFVGRGETPFDAAVTALKVRELRKGLLSDCCKAAGLQLADFLEDREGWHGLDRQDAVEARIAFSEK